MRRRACGRIFPFQPQPARKPAALVGLCWGTDGNFSCLRPALYSKSGPKQLVLFPGNLPRSDRTVPVKKTNYRRIAANRAHSPADHSPGAPVGISGQTRTLPRRCGLAPGAEKRRKPATATTDYCTAGRCAAGLAVMTTEAGFKPSACAVSLTVPPCLVDCTSTCAKPLNTLRLQ